MVHIPLRLEAQHGSKIEEYRVDDGKVQVRSLRSPLRHDAAHTRWQDLTAEELASHVERNTAVAQWLKHRLGRRRLLRACLRDNSPDWNFVEDQLHHDAV